MERITISSSLKFTKEIKQAISKLEKIGVVALFPNLDSPTEFDRIDLEIMKELEAEHFKAIDESEALYVICPKGYVGKLVSAEIGYATAKKKPIIFSETPEDLGIQALASLYIPLEEVEKLKESKTLKI